MRIPLFGLGMLSHSPYVTAKMYTNMYLEQRPAPMAGGGPEKSQLVAYQIPGLNLRIDFGATPPRGGIFFPQGNVAFIVHRAVLWEVNNAGAKIQRGTLNTQTGRVSMASNGTQIIIVDGLNAYIYSTIVAIGTSQTISSITNSGTLATLTTSANHGLVTGNIIVVTGANPTPYNGTYTITDISPTTITYNMLTTPTGSASTVGTYTNPTFVVVASGIPASPTTVDVLNQVFFCTFAGKREVYASAISDGLYWDPLLFLGPGSSTTATLAVRTSNGVLLVFAAYATEFWAPSQQIGFPLTPQQGTAVEWGCAAIWSISKYDNTVALLMQNTTGEQMIASLAGGIPKQISSLDLDQIISLYANVADASGFTYMRAGHQMYGINFGSAGASWMYDESTGVWSKLKSYGITRYRVEFMFQFLSQMLCADYSTGRFYNITPTALTENGDPIEREIIGETLTDADGNFVDVECLRVDCEVGDGLTTGQGSNPQIALSISRNNGKTFGPDMWKDLGMTGEYKTRVEWRRLGGSSRQFTPKIRITDPVPLVVTYACINPET